MPIARLAGISTCLRPVCYVHSIQINNWEPLKEDTCWVISCSFQSSPGRATTNIYMFVFENLCWHIVIGCLVMLLYAHRKPDNWLGERKAGGEKEQKKRQNGF